MLQATIAMTLSVRKGTPLGLDEAECLSGQRADIGVVSENENAS